MIAKVFVLVDAGNRLVDVYGSEQEAQEEQNIAAKQHQSLFIIPFDVETD